MSNPERVTLTDDQIFNLRQSTAEPDSVEAIFADALASIRNAEERFRQLEQRDPSYRHLVQLTQTCGELASIDFRATMPVVYRMLTA